MSTDHEWLDLAAPYALGSLDADEAAAFEAHLATCDACRAEVESFRRVAGLVGLAAPPRQPPPHLKERILREARQVRSIASAPHGRTAAPELEQPIRPEPPPIAPADGAPAAPPPPAGDVLVPIASAAGRRGLRLAFAAVVALCVATSLLALHEARERARAEQRLSLALRARADAEHTLAQRDQLLATLLAPELRTATLSATGEAPSMRLFWDRARHRVVVAATTLPPAPDGRTYQLWGLAPGRAPVSLGTFNTSAQGRAVIALEVPAGLELERSAVTEEPAGGSPAPTTTPFLVGSWRAD